MEEIEKGFYLVRPKQRGGYNYEAEEIEVTKITETCYNLRRVLSCNDHHWVVKVDWHNNYEILEKLK